MGKYFTVAELCKSEKAKIHHIDNVPDDTQREHLEHLINVLDDIREQWGSAIIVTSGFRCSILNRVVGGVATSAHKLGYAADLYPQNGKYKEFISFMTKWAETNDYDQIIEEHSGNSKWLHFGLFNSSGEQRRMKFTIVN